MKSIQSVKTVWSRDASDFDNDLQEAAKTMEASALEVEIQIDFRTPGAYCVWTATLIGRR
jgi:hypothetical protein